MTPIKQRMAYNFIKCWEKYGDDLEELSRVGITKLTLMAALDDEERGELIESGDAERLTTRELEKRVKELLNKNEQLTLKLDEKSKEENALVAERERNERLLKEIETLKVVQNQQKSAADEREKALQERVLALEQSNEQLQKKPVEVAVEKPSKAELDKIAKSAAKKAEEAAKKQYDKEIAELRDKLEASEKANAEKLERLEKEKAALQRFAEHAKKPQPTSQKERVKLHIEECLRNFNEALEDIGALPEDDRANVIEKMKNMADRMKEMLSDE